MSDDKATENHAAGLPGALGSTEGLGARGKARLIRGVTGECGRSECICERDGLGPECIWLRPTDAELRRRTGEPHIDGWPLMSGLPAPKDEFSTFYDETNRLAPMEALGSCDAELAWSSAEIEAVKKRMGGLPRSEKAQARQLHAEMMRLEKHRKRVRDMRRHANEMLEKQDKHRLWCAAVTAVCGEDKLAEVIRWMSNERRRREGRPVHEASA